MSSTSPLFLLRGAAALALLGAPVYWWQGRQLRRRLPRLDEAPGKRSGRLAGDGRPVRLLGAGESPMAAVGLADQSEGLIPRLAERLAAGTGRPVEWATAARSGARADIVRRQLLTDVELPSADAVVVALGVNDSLALRSASRWRNDLDQLLDTIRRQFSPSWIILAGIPPMQVFPALPFPLANMLGLRAAMLDAVTRELVRERPELLHRPTALSTEHGSLFCRDGFHPNADGHARWADQLAEALLPRISAGESR